MRVVNGHKYNITKEHMQRFHGCPYAVGIDIFALDYLPDDEAEYEVLKILYQNTLFTRELIRKQEQNENEDEVLKKEIERCVELLEDFLRFKVDREGNVINQLLCRVEELSAIYTEECNKLGILCYMKLNDRSRIREKSWYDECVLLPFENIQIPAPKEYDAVLRSAYGDYMTPVRGGGAHDYPFYKKYKKEVQEMIEKVKTLSDRLANLEKSLEE